MEDSVVIIIGAGPSGLATAACLSQHSIPYILLEKDDCCNSLWRKHTYDRVNLHLAKEFCSLPFAPHPITTPTYLSKKEFLDYIDNYVLNFDIKPLYHRLVESAFFDPKTKRWQVEVKNVKEGSKEIYVGKFLVVASGENSEGYIPNINGLETFPGEVVHSKNYKSGSKYASQNVLVVGCGNSGMEIAYDLSNHGASTSIVIRNPVHVLSKDAVRRGMSMLNRYPVELVDSYVTMLGNLEYGDLAKYGIRPPKKGPFYLKQTIGRSPVIDVGTIQKIKEGAIEVVPGIARIKNNKVLFENNSEKEFDAIVFATGYISAANNWLKDYGYIFNDKGMPKNGFPNHWKGKNGLYCVGLAKRGLFGVANDAETVVNDISKVY